MHATFQMGSTLIHENANAAQKCSLHSQIPPERKTKIVLLYQSVMSMLNIMVQGAT